MLFEGKKEALDFLKEQLKEDDEDTYYAVTTINNKYTIEARVKPEGFSLDKRFLSDEQDVIEEAEKAAAKEIASRQPKEAKKPASKKKSSKKK